MFVKHPVYYPTKRFYLLSCDEGKRHGGKVFYFHSHVHACNYSALKTFHNRLNPSLYLKWRLGLHQSALHYLYRNPFGIVHQVFQACAIAVVSRFVLLHVWHKMINEDKTRSSSYCYQNKFLRRCVSWLSSDIALNIIGEKKNSCV